MGGPICLPSPVSCKRKQLAGERPKRTWPRERPEVGAVARGFDELITDETTGMNGPGSNRPASCSSSSTGSDSDAAGFSVFGGGRCGLPTLSSGQLSALRQPPFSVAMVPRSQQLAAGRSCSMSSWRASSSTIVAVVGSGATARGCSVIRSRARVSITSATPRHSAKRSSERDHRLRLTVPRRPTLSDHE